jgi:hypothetical protein
MGGKQMIGRKQIPLLDNLKFSINWQLFTKFLNFCIFVNNLKGQLFAKSMNHILNLLAELR